MPSCYFQPMPLLPPCRRCNKRYADHSHVGSYSYCNRGPFALRTQVYLPPVESAHP